MVKSGFVSTLILIALVGASTMADTTDYCGENNSLVPASCRQACVAANDIRRAHRLPLMEVDPAICKAARIQAQNLFNKFGACSKKSKKDCLTHAGQGLSDGAAALAKRLQMAGVGYHCAGENINFGYETLERAFGGWMKSKVHREHLMDSRFRRQGYARVGEYRVHVMAD